MAFKQVQDLDADTMISLGGFNKKLKKDNPTEVEGYYLGSRQVESKKSKTGFASIHYFQTPAGNVGVWGKTDLDRKLASVSVGNMAKAEYSHMQFTPNGEMYKYKVAFDPDNSLDIDTLPVGNVTVKAEVLGNNGEEIESDDIDLDEETQALLAAEQAKRAAKVQALLAKKK